MPNLHVKDFFSTSCNNGYCFIMSLELNLIEFNLPRDNYLHKIMKIYSGEVTSKKPCKIVDNNLLNKLLNLIITGFLKKD